MNAYDAEFLDSKNNLCICTVAESSKDKALEKLKKLWDVKAVLVFVQSQRLSVVNSSCSGLDTFRIDQT